VENGAQLGGIEQNWWLVAWCLAATCMAFFLANAHCEGTGYRWGARFWGKLGHLKVMASDIALNHDGNV